MNAYSSIVDTELQSRRGPRNPIHDVADQWRQRNEQSNAGLATFPTQNGGAWNNA